MAENVIFLSNVRLSFPHIAEPQQRENGKPSYNSEFIMPPNHPGYQQFMQVVGQMAVEKWKEHANNVLQMIYQDRKKRCFGQGSEKVNQKTFKIYDGYENNVYITAGRDTRPQIIGPDGNAIDPSNTMALMDLAKRMYGGCRVNAAVKPWLQDNQHGRGIRCDFVAIQFFQDDEPFGEGVTDVSGMFGAAPAPTTAMPSPAGMPAFLGAPAVPQVQMPAAPFPAAPAPQAPSFGAPQVPSFLQ